MKKRILLLLMSFISLVAVAQQSRTHLIVWSNDGTQVAYAFNEQPKITFSETDLQIKTALVEVSYPLANMARFTYETRDTQGLRDITTDEPIGHFMGESLVFPYLEANSNVAIYTPVGQLLLSKTIVSAGEYAFPLSYLNEGVYLVHVNGLTYKIVKQ
jgi:hypothetical protein